MESRPQLEPLYTCRHSSSQSSTNVDALSQSAIYVYMCRPHRMMMSQRSRTWRILVVFTLVRTSIAAFGDSFQCPQAILTLGDSYSDTGELTQAYTGTPGFDVLERLPYGITYFAGPNGRASDGRLIVDFLCQAFGLRLLDPYFLSVAPDFRNGVNFAASGSRTRPENLGGSPFYLGLQVNQAIRFYNQSLRAPRHTLVPNVSSFQNYGLYYMEDGGNDLDRAIQANASADRIRNTIIPEIVSNFSMAITRLYDNIGARQFLITGFTPFGCTAYVLALGWPAQNPEYGPIGDDGCAQGVNELVKEYNQALLEELQALRSQLAGATIIYADIYPLIYDVITHPASYGFVEAIEACCGSGGPPYNYDATRACGYQEYPLCSPSQYVNWDGAHFTEAAYKIVATALLKGNLSFDPPGFNFSSFCHLDFSKF